LNVVSHHYSSLKNYIVRLIVQNSYGCSDTMKQTVYLRPVIILTDLVPYTQNFENGKKGWILESSGNSGNSSWRFGKSQFFSTSSLIGDSLWYTVPQNRTEQTWISSPCFDFSKVNKPMVKLDKKSSFDKNRDGVVLQYRTNTDNKWKNLGAVNDGLNWFESNSISGKPANQNIGWSGQDNSLVSARHQLNLLVGMKEVRFRFIYGSDGTNRSDNGFAFDNVWIGARPKLVLLEHFTNSSSAKCLTTETSLDALIASEPSDVVDVRYHTDLLGNDMLDPTIHSVSNVRALYYGIPTLPYTKLDGGDGGTTGFDYTTRSLNANDIEMRSLIDPDFNIYLQAVRNGNVFNIDVKINSLTNISNKEITLHVAVVKKEIDIKNGINNSIFKNVLVALLPNAAGTTYSQNWTPGDNQTLSLVYTLGSADTGKINVVTYIQDESTKEILQTASSDRASIYSGIKNFKMSDKNIMEFAMYPNPAMGNVNFVILNIPGKNATIEIFDLLGKVIDIIKLEHGKNLYNVNLAGYQNGIYLVKLNYGNSFQLVKKLVVQH
jgi:hypothetical protein